TRQPLNFLLRMLLAPGTQQTRTFPEMELTVVRFTVKLLTSRKAMSENTVRVRLKGQKVREYET
ncbi:hypothetical protein ACQP3D_29625, partial [Escherichia coli]